MSYEIEIQKVTTPEFENVSWDFKELEEYKKIQEVIKNQIFIQRYRLCKLSGSLRKLRHTVFKISTSSVLIFINILLN